MNPQKEMTIEEALALADDLILKEIGRNLDTIERKILQGALEGRKFHEISAIIGGNESHLRQRGSEIWNALSKKLKYRVHKRNVLAVLENYKASQNLITSESRMTNLTFTESTNSGPILLEDPNAPVPVESKFYIERPPKESDCYRTILQPGALVRISAPKKMGKTSLMKRILHHADRQNYFTLSIDFQMIDSQVWQELSRLLKWLCIKVGTKLNLPNRLNDYWDEELFTIKECCNSYFQEYLLKEISQPIVLAFDKVDYILSQPEVANDFFGLIRGWYESDDSPALQKLRIILVHSEKISITLSINESPFNVGLGILLPEFIPSQVIELASRYGLSWSDTDAKKLINLFGGHPYALRYTMNEIVQHNTSLKTFFQRDFSQIEPYKYYLKNSV
jgi:AAA-like domain